MRALICLICLGILGTGRAEEEKNGASSSPVLPLPVESPTGAPTPKPPVPESESERPAPAAAEKAVPLKKGPETYAKLTTKDGTNYQQCRVIRAEPDALLVEHAGGMAKLSFFDLPEEVQNEWGFDPFKAMERFKKNLEEERALRWRLFQERQAYESDLARQEDEKRLRKEAAREWVPVEAAVIKRLNDGSIIARCQRVIFQKTKTKSTLGFVIDGPPKRVLVAFSDRPVALRFAVPVEKIPAAGSVWKGYVHPVSQGVETFHIRGQTYKAAVHAAASAK